MSASDWPSLRNAAGCTCGSHLSHRGATGWAFMGVRDRNVAAAVIGIRVAQTNQPAFAISSFYCGVPD